MPTCKKGPQIVSLSRKLWIYRLRLDHIVCFKMSRKRLRLEFHKCLLSFFQHSKYKLNLMLDFIINKRFWGLAAWPFPWPYN